jgi:hypothetical protein
MDLSRRLRSRPIVIPGRPALLLCTLSLALVLGLASAAYASPALRTGPRPGIARPPHSSNLRASTRRAHGAIVGGSEIEITMAPWEAAVLFKSGGENFYCSGSIIDLTQILTAGHCTATAADPHGLPPAGYEVITGSNLMSEPATEERSKVALVRSHPYFNAKAPPGAPDDVGILELAAPLTESPAVKPISLAPGGLMLVEGGTVNLTGFGAAEPPGPDLTSNRTLNSLAMTLSFSRECGGEDDALFLCASSPTGSLCQGDSGGALTISGAPVSEVGVTDTVQVISGLPCRDGAEGGFANVTAPEIRDFIEGSETPPLAPRGGGAEVSGVLSAGSSLTCSPGEWSGAPTFTYTFANSIDGQVLQQGPAATYALTGADVGRTIFCQVQAANAGGTGIGRTLALSAIAPATPSSGEEQVPMASGEPPAGRLALAATSIGVRGGRALVKLTCRGPGGCHGGLTLTVRRTVKVRGKRASRRITIASASASIGAGRTATIALGLDRAGRALLSGDHGRLGAILTIVQLERGATSPRTQVVHLSEQRPARAARRR